MNTPRPIFQTLLVLGRVSNLPTVWSNCLAGWLLAGGGPLTDFLLLISAATLLYLAGMFLNDAFDAEFDEQHRRERPIPSGVISKGTVFGIGLLLISGGLIFLSFLGLRCIILGCLLAATILVYDAVHKRFALAPLLMAGCRFFLFLLAAASGQKGVTGEVIWCGLALGSYVVGLSCLARGESIGSGFAKWPWTFLMVPLVLAFLLNPGEYRRPAISYQIPLFIWIVWSLSFLTRRDQPHIPLAVSRLIAGIVLVDLLAVTGTTLWASAGFALLFVSALFFQRFIPAT